MKLKNILRRGGGGGGGGGGENASSKKKSSSSSNENHKNVPETDDIRATNTGSTASHSFSDVPHGSGIFVDTANNNDGATGFLNDVVVAIKTPRKMRQLNTSNNNKKLTNQPKPPSKSKPSASASLPSLDFAEILQAGYSVLSCVAQCRPMNNATTTTEIPTVIDPALNEDHHTVGELTLLTIEREEHRREMISAAKDRAAEITAGIVGMGVTTTAANAATAAAPTTSGHDVSRQFTSMNMAAARSSAPEMHNHQRQQQQPRVHANIGSLLDDNHMQVKAQALLEKANSQNNAVHRNHAVQMQHSVDDSASFNMPPVNADDVCVAKQAPPGETFIGRYGARPSLSDDDDDESTVDEIECDSIDGQIGRW